MVDKSKRSHKILFLGGVLVALAFVFSSVVFAQTDKSGLGNAWSQNIGWVMFGAPNGGPFKEKSDGSLSGFGWSANIGWVQFCGLTDLPFLPGTVAENAVVNANGTISGWARACAGTAQNTDAPSLPSPIAWWELDEVSGTSAGDSSGNGNTGTLYNNTSWVIGKINNGLSTDTGNVNSWMQVPSIAIGSSWTAAWWSYFPLATFTGSWRTMFRGSLDHQVIVDSSGNVGVYDNQSGTGFHSSGYNINSLSSLSPGWHHITAVGSGSNTTFYIDGNIANPHISNYKSINSIDSVGNFQGGYQNWGKFDDVRIYNQVLTNQEVKALYNSYLPVSSPGNCTSMTSRTDGWGGGVSLRGTTPLASSYGLSVSGNQITGYAWGSDVIGWLQFNIALGGNGSCDTPSLNGP